MRFLGFLGRRVGSSINAMPVTPTDASIMYSQRGVVVGSPSERYTPAVLVAYIAFHDSGRNISVMLVL